MTQDHTAFPNICKASYEMAAANNSPHNKTYVDKNLDMILGAEDVYFDDLKRMDDWIGTLDAAAISCLVDGEETEMQALMAASPNPEQTKGLMDDIFDNAI